MNKKELVAKLAEEKDLTKARAEELVDAIIGTISEELIKGETVKVPGFGNFVVKTRKERQAVIPNSNQKVVVPAYRVVAFKPAKNFKEQVK